METSADFVKLTNCVQAHEIQFSFSHLITFFFFLHQPDVCAFISYLFEPVRKNQCLPRHLRPSDLLDQHVYTSEDSIKVAGDQIARDLDHLFKHPSKPVSQLQIPYVETFLFGQKFKGGCHCSKTTKRRCQQNENVPKQLTSLVPGNSLSLSAM